MSYKKKVSDDVLIDSYKRTGNVWKTAKEVGMCGQSVNERIQKLGIGKGLNKFTKEEQDRLSREYLIYRNLGKLSDLAKQMNRTKQFICRQAKAIGLTDMSHKKPYLATWKYMQEETALLIFEDFKQSNGTVAQYCARKKYDDLGFSRTMQKFFPDEWDLVIESKHPRQTMYRLGRALEYRCRDYMKKKGYFTLRSPRSGGPIDVVGIKKGIVLFVQCKRSGALGVKEWNELFDVAKSVDAKPIMAMQDTTGRGILWFELFDKKDGSKKKQPMARIDIL